MLQLMTSTTAQGGLPGEPAIASQGRVPAAQPAADGLPASFVLEAPAALEPLADALLASEPGALADDGNLPADPAALADSASPLPLDPSNPAQQELSAEQWLLSMLGQRMTTVEARDGEASPSATSQSGRVARAVQQAAPLPPGTALDLADSPAGPTQAMPAATPDDSANEALVALLAARAADGGASNTSGVTVTGEQAGSQALADLGGSAAAATGQLAPAVDASQAQVPQLERHLKLQAPEAKWGEQMLNALRDNVELQLQQKLQSATIRLDPPELGSLEILLSHESGRLNVQISAANGDVARLLQNTSERLRQELVGQNFLQVNVQVSADSQSGQQGQQQARVRQLQEEAVLAAAPQAEDNNSSARQGRPGRDVLVTV